jgi:CHAT domain-containing protein/tetratricopeptide (TPR) repeat protein
LSGGLIDHFLSDVETGYGFKFNSMVITAFIGRSLPLLFVIVFANCTAIAAQSFDSTKFKERDSVISALIADEDYEQAMNGIKQQVDWLIGLEKYDSLYRYTYNIGRAAWRSKSAERGAEESRQLVELFMRETDDVSLHLKVLVDLSWIYSETGDFRAAFSTDSLYVAIMEGDESVRPKERYTGYYNLAYGYYSLGQMNRAVEYFQKALDQIVNEPPEKLILDRIIDGYNALGALYYRAGDHRNARVAFERCLNEIEQGRGTIDESFYFAARANALGNISIILQDLGDMIGSKEVLEEAIQERIRALELTPSGYATDQINNLQMSSYRNLAAIYIAIGDYNRAERLLEFVLDFRTKYLAPDDPRIASTLEGFISIYLARGDFEAALRVGQNFLKSCLDNFGPDSYFTANALEQMGQISLQKGELEEANVFFTRTLKTFRKVQESRATTEQAGVLIKRHNTFREKGSHDKAMTDLSEASEIYYATRDADDPVFGDVFLSKGLLYFEMGEIARAGEMAAKAHDLLMDFRASLPQSADNILSNRTLALPEVLHLLAKIELSGGDDKDHRDRVSDYLRRAINLIKNAEALLESEEAKISFYDSHESIFNLALDNCFELYRLTDDLYYLDQFFILSEENKSTVLRNRLNWFSSISFSGVPDSVVAEERRLSGILTGRLPMPEGVDDIYQVDLKYSNLLDKIRAEYPSYFSFRHAVSVPGIMEFRESLDSENVNAISFSQTSSGLYAVIILPEGEHLIKLDADTFALILDQYNKALASPSFRNYTELGQRFFDLVFKPLEGYLNRDKLVIIPDKDIFSVNFEALVRSTDHGQPHFLIRDYTISYLMSATTQVQFRQLERDAPKGLIAVSPGFSNELKEEYLQFVPDSIWIDKEYLRQLPQPFAVESSREINNLFSGTLLTGSSATRENILGLVDQYGIIHFGTHAEINNLSPLLSRFILSRDPGKAHIPDDGYLHVYDIYNTELNAELAVLMACETGEGKRSGSEGIVSLAHSFAYAGCPGIVMAMWKIDEKTSSDLIRNFYLELKEGRPKNEALREAKLAHLDNSS